MCRTLERFQKACLQGSAESSFTERFRFWKKEKDRNTCLHNLDKWNKRMTIMVDAACRAAEKRPHTTVQSEGPSSHLRILSRRLFNTLQKCWSCNCKDRHEARFCLASCIHSTKDLAHGVYFDFLVADPRCQTQWKWREGHVMIKTCNAPR